MYNQRFLLFILFFISGFSGLIYESIWTHYLKLFLGHSAYAQTLVLAIFMGGMAIGAWICSRISVRFSNLFLIYALAEGTIGISALLFHFAFVSVTDYSFVSVIPALHDPYLIQLYKWSLASVLVLPQSILLGMTFPLMSSGLIRLFPLKKGSSIALLYFTNSFGGAIGVLISGFVTIKLLGLNGTIALAGIINILLALTVWRLFRSQPAQPLTQKNHRQHSTQLFRLMSGVALLTGTASFIYEITWIRMLSLVLGSSTHAFELMLSAFILGLAAGGFWISRRIEKINDVVGFLVYMQVFMGLAALSTLPLYGQTFRLMQWGLGLLEQNDVGFASFNLFSHALSMLIMFPATFFAGTTLPLITHVLIKNGGGERAIGSVYGFNTLGAIIGIIFTIHIGFPYLGTKGALIVGATIDIALGLVLIWRYGARAKGIRRTLLLASAVGAVCFVAFAVELSPHKMSSGVYRNGKLLPDDQRVLSYIDGKTSTISLTATASNVYAIRTNGKADASINMQTGSAPTFDEITMTLAAVIPMLLYPEAQHFANIGFGSGMTSNVLLANPRLASLDTVEIEPAMVETAKLFHPINSRVYLDPRSQIHIADAKTFFSANNKKYDIIISEPSNPWVSGVAGLFSREFYQSTKRHLNEKGIVAQWLQVYEFDTPLLFSVLKAVASEFEHFTIYAADHGDLLILASDSEIADLTGSKFSSIPELQAEISRVGVYTPEDLRLRWIGDRHFLNPILNQQTVPMNSDYFPYVDQNAARARFMGSSANDIFFPISEILPIRAILAHRELSPGMATRISMSLLTTLSSIPYQATYLLARMKGQYIGPKHISSKLDSELNKINTLIADCKVIPAHGDKVYLMYRIAVPSLPFLSSAELKNLWSSMEEMACGSKLNHYEESWLLLFKAIGQRNTTRMQDLTEQILQKPQYLTKTRMKYLLGIHMLGLLAEEKYLEARLFWQKNSGEIAEDVADSPQFIYLLALAKSNTGRGGPH